MTAEDFRLGITSRLLIAFGGVATLALAANLLVEQEVRVERTTEITRTLPPTSIPRSELPPAFSATGETHSAPLEPRPFLTSDSLRLALDAWQESVRERLDSDTEQSEARYQHAQIELDAAAATYVTSAGGMTRRSLSFIEQALHANRSQAAELIASADARRAQQERYAAALESMNTHDKAALAGSYRIFGRVIARQSLLQLSADLDALRQTGLVSTEQSIQMGLEVNQASLRHAQGDGWYEAMCQDFANLIAARQAADQINAHLRQGSQALWAETADVSKKLPARLQGLEVRPAVAPPDGTSAPPNAPDLSDAWSKSLVTAPSFQVNSIEQHDPRAHERRIQLAWISAFAMGLLAFVAVGTIVSIVRPVRRLLEATVRLAKGDGQVTVQRGGIKELDTLAVAFNAMAQELSASRTAASDYQALLEHTVEQRTRELRELAEQDPLTNLPNRRELFVLLNAALERARANGGRVGVFFLDIDNFKYINDSMGHAFGDRVLASLAQRLQAATQAFGFAARLGGDEFTVVFEHGSDEGAVTVAGLSIVQAFQAPLTVDSRDLIVSVSVGASIFPSHGTSAEVLLKAADAALFRAKAMGRSQLSVFTPDLLESAAAKFSTEQGLRRAVERREFELLFQPEVSIEALETVVAEALIRWRMPDGSLASPSAFLGVAEESGLIMDISDWVLEAAIEAAAEWHHGAWPQARVAINVSSRQLIDVGFFDRLYRLLEKYHLPPRCLEIELTESVLQTGPATIAALWRLRDHGVAIALDDFGTGYSSLASVEQLPLTRIKLDRSLIAGIDTSQRCATMAQAIISMCQGLGLEVTAEGVERSAQLAMLRQHRGITVQGYLLARPTPRNELLSTMTTLTSAGREVLAKKSSVGASRVIGLRQSRSRN